MGELGKDGATQQLRQHVDGQRVISVRRVTYAGHVQKLLSTFDLRSRKKSAHPAFGVNRVGFCELLRNQMLRTSVMVSIDGYR